ncbi:MAG TPA: retroviral-like aspartic protease family protein [Sphingomicrobium sp.]|nr:retroviral-like aspartic protease family protein [Sphingomicrobium sp.]
MRHVAAILIFAGMSAAAQTVTQVETVGETATVDAVTQTQDVRFKTDNADRMTVPVTLGGRGPFRFLVDTGADRTVVSRQVAGRLRFDPGPSATMHSISGASSVPTARLPQLSFSKRQVDGLRAVLLDGNHVGADGVLGTDSLRSQRILFDFKRQLLSITPTTRELVREERGTIVVRAKEREGRLIVTDAFANGARVRVIIDTGSQFTIGNTALRRAMLGTKVSKDSIPVVVQSVTGATLPGEVNEIAELQLGEVKLAKLKIVYADAHTFRQLGMDDRPALLLGMNALRAFQLVSIDFAKRRLRVLLPGKGSSMDQDQLAAAHSTRRRAGG